MIHQTNWSVKYLQKINYFPNLQFVKLFENTANLTQPPLT